MKTFTATTIVLTLASAVCASPVNLIARANVCNTAPSGPSGGANPRSSPSAATADACQQRCVADSGCLSFVFGMPTTGTTPLCEIFGVAAAQVPVQSNGNFMVFDKACTGVPTAAPTQTGNNGQNGGQVNNGQANGGQSNGGQNSGQNNNGQANNGRTNGGQGNGQPKKRANVCGASPSGPTTNNPTPLQSLQNIDSQEACLARCRQTTGCKS